LHTNVTISLESSSMSLEHLPKFVFFFVELPPIMLLGVVANVTFVYRDDESSI
jgi:hypothetical protein